MAEHLGYFGVLVPENLFYQGYYLTEDLLPEGERVLRQFRERCGGYYLETSAVNWQAPDVKTEDQHVFGSLCGAMVDVAISHPQTDAPGKLAAAMHLLSGHRFFYVQGQSNKTGASSTYRVLDRAVTVDEARNAINGLPSALLIKKKLAEHLRRNPPTRRQ